MPNYRKKKQSNNNKRNKNKNQNKNNSSSSSVRQEVLSDSESVGIEPNLPADVCFSRIGTTASANVAFGAERDFAIVDDSLTANIGETDDNACNIDTCSSDTIKQSNCSSSFYSSSTTNKSIATIDRQSERTAFDGDSSTFGSSTLSDEFEAGTGINSLKTGSAQTKDAAVPTAAEQSATRITETTRISSVSGERHESGSKEIRNIRTRKSGISDDRVRPLIVHDFAKDSSQTGEVSEQNNNSKVIRQECKTSLASQDESHFKYVSVQQSPQDEHSKVIVQHLFEDKTPLRTEKTITKVTVQESPQEKSKVITQRVEETRTTSHTASKKKSDQPSEVLVQKTTKRKVSRTTTSALPTTRSEEDSKDTEQSGADQSHKRSSSANSRKLAKVSIQHVSKEDSTQPVDYYINPPVEHGWETSTVIVHPISFEDSSQDSFTLPNAAGDTVSQESSTQEALHDSDHSNQLFAENAEADSTSKVIVHPILQENQKDSSSNVAQSSSCSEDHQKAKHSIEEEGHSPKVVVIPIVIENPSQTSIPEEPCYQRSSTDQETPWQQQSEPPIFIEYSSFPEYIDQRRSPASIEGDTLEADVVFEPLSRERSPESSSSTNSIPAEGSEPLTLVIVDPIIQERSTHSITIPPAKVDADANLWERPNTPSTTEETTDHITPTTSFPVCRSPKGIVHQIHRHAQTEPVFPLTPASLEKLDQSSKRIAHQILEDVSSELQSSFRAEIQNHTLQNEPHRKTFPVTTARSAATRPGFFETNIFETEPNPVDVEAKVIIHPIFKDEPAPKQSTSIQTEVDSIQPVQKKINDQAPIKGGLTSEVIISMVSREVSKSTQSNSISKINGDDLVNAHRESTVYVHDILKDSNQTGKADQSPNQENQKTYADVVLGVSTKATSANLDNEDLSQSESVQISAVTEIQQKSRSDLKTEATVIQHSITKEEKTRECSTIFPLFSKDSTQFTLPKTNASKEPIHIPMVFPLTTYKQNYPAQYTSPQNFESKGGDLDILREQSDLRQSSSTLTSPFALTITDPRVQNETTQTIQKTSTILEAHSTVFPLSAGKTKTGSLPHSTPSFPVVLEESQKGQATQAVNSDHTTEEIDPENSTQPRSAPTSTELKIIEHSITKEETTQGPSTIFPLSSKDSTKFTLPQTNASKEPTHIPMVFPLTTYKQNYPAQYTSPQNFESKGGDLDILREQSDLRQSSSTLTSPFALTVTDPRVQNESTQTIQQTSTILEAHSTVFPLSAGKTGVGSHPHSTPSFPVVLEESQKVRTAEKIVPENSTQPCSAQTSTELKIIEHPITKEETTQEPSTIFPLSSKNSTQIAHLKPKSSKEPTSYPIVFPLSTYKPNYPVQYTSPQNFESKGGDLEILREQSDLRQSSSTLTSPFALTITDPRVEKFISQTTNQTSTISSTPLTAFPISANKTGRKNKPKGKTGSVPQSPQSFPIPPHLASTAINTEPTKQTSSASDLQAKVIVHTVSIVPDDPTSSSPIKDIQSPDIDRQSSQEDTSSSSDRSDLTAIHVLSAQATSPPLPPEDQKENPKSPRSSFFLTSLELSNQIKDQGSNTEAIHKEPEPKRDESKLNNQDMSTSQEENHSPKVIVHQITRENESTPAPKVTSRTVITHPIGREKTPPKTALHPLEKPLGYRVDSPQPDVRLAVMKKSKSLDDEDLVIQEMSDASSAGDTDNPPVVSEAESETDTLEAVDDFPDTPTSSHLLSIQTLPIDHVDETTDQTSLKTSQEYKIRRQQNRVALETHFLPQFLSPIFLDSIKEENSDLSDSDRRSEGSDRNDHTHQQGDHEGDALHEDGLHAKNADAVFPKSNLDFSKKHKHIHTNVRPQNVIREEAPPPSVVEAKIIDHVPIEEGCGSWSTDITPECDTAEVVYIDSASSSVSDLLELDYSQGQSDDTIDVRIQTPTIDLESVNEMFSDHRSESNERIKTTSPPPSLPPVKEDENISEQILLPPLTASAHVETTKTEITTTAPTKSPNEIILEKIETMSQAVAATDDDRVVDCATTIEHVQNSKANSPNSCDSAINQVVTNDEPFVAAVGVIEKKMENIREIVNASSQQSELDTITDADHDILKPNFKIGEPCSDHTFKCDTTTTTNTTSSTNSLCTSSITTSSTITSNTSIIGTQILTLHDLSSSPGDAHHLHPLGVSNSALDRQGSLDSHGSDQSHSTNQSQCTAINQGSLPHSDWNEFDTTADTSYVSGSDTAGLASSENSSPITTRSEAARSADATDLPPVKKLRSLCTEALASMPYGEEVLEELATVAQNIGDMPYPLPEIPHIRDIQVSLQSEPQQKSSTITLTQVPPRPTASVGKKLRTPPPPPVPEPPSKYESWLGVPTESDPNVLVCLSPSQRTAVKDDTTPDSLLDMHKKFVERRGYHEYTKSQVKAMNKENSYESVKLSKSNSPPPSQPPATQSKPTSPPPPPLNGSETAPPTDLFADDQNNHLSLLAIIRDTHDQQTSTSSTTSFRENISRQNESGPNTISPTHTIKTPNDGGGWENFANPQSVNKQTQERLVSESINQSKNSNETMQSEQSKEHTIQVEREPIMGLRFPTSDYFDSIFDKNKRFSNIETGASPGFCSQILSTKPKRYSNIETSTFESRKCVENGKVLYDISDSKKQTVREGEKPDPELTSFPQLGKKSNDFGSFPFISATIDKTDLRPKAGGDSENIMSEFKLNEQMTAAPPPPTAPAHRVEQSPPAPPVPPLPATLIDTTATTTTTTKSTSTTETVKNRNFSGETQNEALFDDFRQRAKEAATGEQQSAVRTTSATTRKSDLFDREKLFKDFDELSNLLKDELESGKRRPPVTVDGSEIPVGISDYNALAKESKIQSSHVSSSTTEYNRREQMKKLAEEIDRTSAQRQQTRREMRVPIRIEKPVRDAPEVPLPPRSYEIPVQVEKTTRTEQRIYEIPVRVESGTSTDREALKRQRSYEIPIRVEHETGTRQRTRSEHQKHHDAAPVRSEKPREQPERFRRAESMFNISEATSSRHKLQDDWMKYVGDLGSSENICKPFQREVEICYRGRRPNIRAPRLSASTSDLSSIHSYDTHGAYDVKRTTTTQTINSQQPPRRRYLSTQSMIDTTPITPCVSSRRSPVRERRSSLPREIHDQQLKYISSKEHQLQIEFERLENERRQLIDEMNRAQINQRINREAYRQRQLPPLTEDENFRQQMAEEWLHKVAEREERRLQKIIKISKINQDGNFPTVPPRRTSASDIGDEFLRRVKERRSKLCMPSDSDWESGAESQPVPRIDGNRSETDEPPIKILEGQSEADLKHLPQHLREFAKLTSQTKEEHREETTENTSSRAIKKSSIVTTVKTSNATNTANTQESLQKDAARVRDLEQLSQGKRQKPVTILRHKKPAESSSSGGCQPKTEAAVPPTAGSSGSGGGVKRRKQTRFLLTPNRRSWSESDLLREIDKELVLAKGFLYANGVWTPKNQTPTSSRSNLNEFQPHNTTCPDKIVENRSSSACGHKEKGHSIPTPPPPPLWTPQPERKQFRPVHFESPVLQRRYVRQQSNPSEAPPPPPWSYTNSQPFPGYQSQSCSNLSQKGTAIPWPPAAESAVNKNCAPAPTASPVVDDEEIFTPTTSIAEKIRSFERSTSNSELHRPFLRHNPHEKPAILRPNEVIYSVKNEYMSEPETEYDKPKKMAQLSRRQYDGIGPTTKHGMPVILRSEVKEPNQHEWYKRIFQTIHKQKNPDDYVTIRYKCPRGRYPYKSNGYMSEPEPNYDSDYSTVKYRTLERRHLQSTGTDTGIGSVTGHTSQGPGKDIQDDTVYGTMPNPVKSGQGSYKVQPGRIEDYVTGYSSVSEKEKKEWWDEVMDIFNGWLKDNAPLPRVFIEFANDVEKFQLEQQKLSPQYTEGNLSRALLKEQGYTSDSNLVFRKKDVPQQQSPLSPVEQKQVYKSVQLGGQPPLLGFRKPAPEKPKESEFEYLPITPTLTKIRVHSKEAMSKKKSSETTHAAQRELICYPITNLSRPIDMFAPFPKHVPSFIPMNQPPLPPNRKSSRTRTTSMALRISSSEVRRPTSANSSRHEACFQTKDAVSPPPPRPAKYGTITLRKTVRRTEPLVRSKSAGAVVNASNKEDKAKDARVSRKQQTIRLSACSPVRSASRLSTLRTSSRSPVAFGRSVSKERSFAEEKKRIEETLPSIRTDFTASTNILRDPTLKSPDQVKRAVRSYAFPMERSKSAPRVLSPTKPAQSSYMSTYVVRRVASPSRKEVSAVRKPQTSSSARSTVKAPIVRSKSQSSKLSEKCTSRPMTKTTSTVSLARTSSTFSVDSTASKVKPIPKKPLTIARPTEVEKAKRKPITISSSKSDTNIMRKVKESSEAKQKIVKAIPSQQKLIRTNHFFKNLFMRGLSPSKTDDQLRQSSVSEKAKYWNTMSLPIRKSISDSRHLSYQQCRSLSPPGRPQFVEEYESVEHFQSDDEASEFGDYSGRTEDLVWQYEQRSRSEPRTTRVVTDIARPESPARVFPREFSPTREIRVPQTREMRSPSRRRIQSYRDSQRGDTGKVIRASSLSSADDRSKRSLYNCDDISHSANSLEYIERHSPSCRLKNSNRFIDLNRFYSTLERVGQLECATSATSLKPIRKEGQAIDFEEWRKIRFHERAERELNYLVGRLKEDQKQKDFLFRPKDVEDVKWTETKDLSLRSKDKSVEDLRENFEKKIHQEWLDESKRLELESKKDTYKPYWRGSSVADLASSMEIKFNPESGSFGIQKLKSESAAEKPLCLSNRLISTLSKDQVSKITQQLNEIYNPSEPKTKPDITEEYVITVDKHTPANALKVRCNSSISKEELIGPVLRRKEAHEKSPPRKTFDRLSQEVRKFESELTESEKRRLSQTFSREIQGKARSGSPVLLARETRGAIAAENAKNTMPDIPPPPPLPKNLLQTKKSAPSKPKRKTFEIKKDPSETALKIDTITTETIEKPDDTVSKKIQYFEDRQFEEPAKTIYHAREDSSPDEDEVMRVIEQNIKARAQSEAYRHRELSSSVTDIKDLFGERESSRINFPLPRPPPPPDETIYHETKQDQHRSTSLTLSASRDGSIENLETLFRSRSVSPLPPGHSYLQRVHTGEVRKIKDKFESLGRPKKKKHFFAISPLRKVRSDPELSNDGSKDTFKTVVREHEVGDVSWITHKFEVQNSAGRGRSRIRKPGSPIQRMPLRKEDRLMPHIDIISKTASLKQEMMKSRSPSPVRQQATLHSGEVERIRCIFETSPDRDTVQEQTGLGTSSPELRDISAHLTASWIAHKYPKPLDNDVRSKLPLHEKIAKSLSMPITGIKRHARHFRSRSISPPKSKQKEAKATVTSILKPRFDFFANQKFDPSIHRPKARYVPDSGEDLKKKPPPSGNKKTSAVKFKDDDEVPPPPVPPTKGVSLDSNGLNNLESPNRYFESDVNIHYKTPIRYEYKDPIPDEELAIRQAETMQKLYQEERRRKYLQELQDMNSRRHTDNFTPSQKSPIPLNRYDDFNSDLAPKSPNNSSYPKTIARALYNFQGQTARELTFKKGDVIYIRRQIDKNWYEGEHNAMIGLLPSNYVELITKDGIRQPPKRPSEGQARAKYNFQAQSGIELSLNKGEHVTLTRRVDDNWFEGKIANRKGIFPVSYVEILVDIGADDKVARAPTSQSTITQTSLMRPSLDTLRTNINNEFNSLTSNGQPPNGILRETRTLHKTEVLHVDTNTEPIAYRALYKYRPQNTDELELQEGDIVYVLEKCDDGWFVGTSQRSGCFGTFPGNYVERV